MDPSGTDGKTKEAEANKSVQSVFTFGSGHGFITSFVWRVRVSFAIHYSCGPPRRRRRRRSKDNDKQPNKRSHQTSCGRGEKPTRDTTALVRPVIVCSSRDSPVDCSLQYLANSARYRSSR